MFLILSASKDTYVTNKIIDNTYRVTDTNIGVASTLDLFKLWQESTFLSGSARVTGSVQELSRLLVKFDYGRLGALTSSILNINHPSFKCTLKMFDINGGQGVPSNFTVVCHPLSHSFDEGIGRDVISFKDVGTANFITASYNSDTSTNNAWFVSGANASGSLGDTNIDIIERDNVGASNPNAPFFKEQYFSTGRENLAIDVTSLVSASLAQKLVNHGFRLAFTSSQEWDHKTRFVKRFGSRHVSNRKLRPRLEVTFDDSIIDHHKNFFFDLSGSLFLQNYHRGQAAAIFSGSSLTPLGGQKCMVLELVTGSFMTSSHVSQHTGSTNLIGMPGLYSASFCIPFVSGGLVHSGTGWSGDTIRDFARKSGSLTFETYWKSSDRTIGFYTGSLKIKTIERSAFSMTAQRLDLVVTNARSSYKKVEKVKFRVFVYDLDKQRSAGRIPISIGSEILDRVYYSVRDINSGEVVIPFETVRNGTRLSTDSDGLFFEMFMEDLTIGRMYTFDFLINDRGVEFVEEATNVAFRVES
ncbi:MAG TPA: hypothetical protein EYQ26_01995 [Rhodospirillales bacterium]|nr:hypothetical protein [Rhodospirillales bacterium]